MSNYALKHNIDSFVIYKNMCNGGSNNLENRMNIDILHAYSTSQHQLTTNANF